MNIPLYKTAVFRSWGGMIQRCYNPKNPAYHRYGGAGIRACEFIRVSALNLHSLIGHRPAEWMSLDRIDNKLGYLCGQCAEGVENNWPINVRWADRTTQNRNQNDLNFIEVDGQKRCLSEWAEIYGMERKTIWFRFERGIRGRDLFAPVRKPITATINGETKTIAQWAKLAGITQGPMLARIRNYGENNFVLAPSQQGSRYFKNENNTTWQSGSDRANHGAGTERHRVT